VTSSPIRPPDSNVSALLDERGEAPPVKVPVVAFAAVTAAVPVCFIRMVLFIAFEVVISVAALVTEVVNKVAALVLEVVRGLVVVIRITGSVGDLVEDVVKRGALMVVVLTFVVIEV
jgi:hypothetical protein